jgi:MoxR-like ATPase
MRTVFPRLIGGTDKGTNVEIKEFRETYARIKEQMARIIVGQEAVVDQLIISVLAEGHVILTGVPGLGRTLLAETLGKVLGLTVSRIQFTPDLLPTDVTGTEVLQMTEGEHKFRYMQGPVFANLVLADEINRSPARTQASLLESMQEKQVSVNGVRYPLPKPFLVIATQNTLDTEGVYPLPEAQLDRFLMQIEMDYPSAEEEDAIIDRTTSTFSDNVVSITDPKKLLELQQFAKMIPVAPTIKEFAVSLVRASRLGQDKSTAIKAKPKRTWWGGLRRLGEVDRVAQYIRWGASPRAGQALLRAGKIAAIINGRSYVTREDIMSVAHSVMSHRVIPDHRAGAKGLTSRKVAERLIDEVCLETAPKPATSRMRSVLAAMGR